MALILNIDTAVESASICLASDDNILELSINENQKDHAAWLHSAIADLLKKSGKNINNLDAVAVSIGPGSYTGLRVGLASAKGLSYALNIPLLAIGTLKMIAVAAKEKSNVATYICPLIDARRMEVFTSLYDRSLNEINAPSAMIIDENSFADILASEKILFCGSGSKKLQTIIKSENALFNYEAANAAHLSQLSYYSFRNREFADLAYAEPLYIKEFYSSPHKA